MAFLSWGLFKTKMNTATEQIEIRTRVSLGWMFASGSDYNKRCGLAGECCIFTIDRPSSLQQSAKGGLFWAKTSIRLWWEKQSCNQWRIFARAVDEKWTLHVSSGEGAAAQFFKPHFHAWTTTLKTFFEHEREWYNSSFMSRTFLSSSRNSTLRLQQGSVKFQKDKILSNFKESSNIHFKCLMQMYYFHLYFDGRILLM